MKLAHCTLLTTHPGVKSTIELLRRKFYWPSLAKETELFVNACITCGRVKQPKAYLKAPHSHVIAHEFNRGNRNILTMTDLWSGYVVAVPTKTQEAEETIKKIMHHWVLRFGMCREIIADNGSGFSSKLFKAVLQKFGCKDTHGLPYRCASTSKVEWQNKRLNVALRVSLTENQIRNWYPYLDYVCFSLNGLQAHRDVCQHAPVRERAQHTPLYLSGQRGVSHEFQEPRRHGLRAPQNLQDDLEKG